MNDTKWPVKAGSFFKRKNVDVYLFIYLRETIQKIHSHNGIWGNKSIFTPLKESRRSEGSTEHLLRKLSFLGLTKAHTPIPPSSCRDRAPVRSNLKQPRVLLLVTVNRLQEILQRRMTILKQKLIEGNLGEQRKVGRWEDFRPPSLTIKCMKRKQDSMLIWDLSNWQLIRKKHIHKVTMHMEKKSRLGIDWWEANVFQSFGRKSWK